MFNRNQMRPFGSLHFPQQMGGMGGMPRQQQFGGMPHQQMSQSMPPQSMGGGMPNMYPGGSQGFHEAGPAIQPPMNPPVPNMGMAPSAQIHQDPKPGMSQGMPSQGMPMPSDPRAGMMAQALMRPQRRQMPLEEGMPSPTMPTLQNW